MMEAFALIDFASLLTRLFSLGTVYGATGAVLLVFGLMAWGDRGRRHRLASGSFWIILGLIFQRDAGTDACMHKDRLLGHKACGPAFQKTQMVGRHSGNCIGVDWPNGPIPCAAHTVRGQGDSAAQFGVQPRMFRL